MTPLRLAPCWSRWRTTTSFVVSVAATISPELASTPMCSLRQDRRPPGALLLNQPFAGSAQLQTRAVDQQMEGLAVSTVARARPRHLHRLGPPAERGEGGHRQADTKQIHDRADQALGLAQSQSEHRLQRQRRQDRLRRVPGLTSSGGPRRGAPGRDGLLAEPNGDPTALTQARVVGCPGWSPSASALGCDGGARRWP
jgi:hypothetical protein